VTEETRKKGKAKKKKSGQNIVVINFYFCNSCNNHHICRHKKEEGKGVKTPLYNLGEFDSDSFGILFGPASKGPSK
jgi:hypothetical protein